MINETSSEYRELFNSLESYNSLLSKNLGNINRIDGWMERSSEEAPYNGEGSLVYFGSADFPGWWGLANQE